MVATKQQGNAHVTLYLRHYKTKYGYEPLNFNRYRDLYGFMAMIDDLGYDRAKEVINYYFDTERYGHPVNYLLYNYDKLNRAMIDEAEDEIERAKLRAESKIRVEQWQQQKH
jgi:hypothetical protein